MGHDVCTIPLYLSAFFTFQHWLVIYRVIIRSIPHVSLQPSSHLKLDWDHGAPFEPSPWKAAWLAAEEMEGCPLTPAMTCCPPRMCTVCCLKRCCLSTIAWSLQGGLCSTPNQSHLRVPGYHQKYTYISIMLILKNMYHMRLVDHTFYRVLLVSYTLHIIISNTYSVKFKYHKNHSNCTEY